MTEGKKRSQGHLCLHRFVTVEHQEASQRCGNYICKSQVLCFVLKSRVNDFFLIYSFFFFFLPDTDGDSASDCKDDVI